ncbi:MAG: inner membrane-spanning protein YciB [Pseudomonadota bacterium]
MQVLFEFLPLIVFLAAYLYKDIFFAMIVLMIAMPIGLAVKYFQTRKLDKMYFWSTVLLLVFGAASLYFRDATLFYWKPTVFYWAAAAGFLASQFFMQKPLVQRFFEFAAELPTEQLSRAQWTGLNTVWVLFFAALGALNLYVAYSFSEDFWVKFKVFGLLGITFAFLIAQGAWLMSRLEFDDADPSDGDT